MMRPETLARLTPMLQDWHAAWPDALRPHGTGSKRQFLKSPAAPLVSLPSQEPLLEHDVEDQVAVAWAGATVRDIQSSLAEKGQSLMLPGTGHFWLDGAPGTLGGLISMNLPHGLSGPLGGPKQWVLGLLIMRPDGRLVRVGSKAVKSVAGYDGQKLLCGARGRLGFIVAAAVRVLAVKTIPASRAEAKGEADQVWIQRVRPSDWERAQRQDWIARDSDSSTLWLTERPIRFEGDWMVGPKGELDFAGRAIDLEERAREILDPRRRFVV